MSNKVKIEITPQSQGTKIFVDGVELQNVVSVDVRAAVDEASLVTVRFTAKEIEIEGESHVVDAAHPDQLILIG